ncbi:glutathione S-transferase [Vibrio vulnificus]|uniref:glutathione S-transferase family protein n=1 Tax=Vibrio vulnificus TaxID=672 RepID=UPI00063DA597|nr:glutathione S-transferase [Vibrio vulnificus]EGR0106920.1 glutathione S-transferase [Vibrio vulnificus]EGR0111334.1 glutathione S-transferase [Vibrio vulnificus]EGR1424018.1 glutathione S-transferase [Vibrio vulnificus]EHU4944622.1 glutathione S-transferase [Vibrio vulnificus]EIF5015957.1 glutathione S-transferase [Vibrio vulnificus]
MITLHHLNKSRSKRIIWLLEELGVDYQVVAYQRDSVTFLAPPELKAIHPLGKSPVIEADGKVIAESGAITEYLIAKHAPLRLAPAPESAEYVEYLQWLHFAESSGILPLLLKVFLTKDGAQTQFLAQYADAEINKVVGYLDQSLQGKNYLVGETLSGADIMNSFIVEIVQQFGLLEQYPNLARYADTLASHPSFVKAQTLEQQYN